MTEGKAAICYRSRSEECHREAALREATAALANPSALIALRLFDKVSSQWEAPMGERLGLKYEAVWGWADRFGVPLDEETMEYVQVLEIEQLDASKPAKKEGGS